METKTATVRTESATWRAMGSTAEITVVADTTIVTDLVSLGQRRVELLEQCWSRFRPTSELVRLNAHAGQGPLEVSDDLLTLVVTMIEGWERTNGLFDPTVLQSVTAHGYDADFTTVIARDYVGSLQSLQPARGMADIVVDPIANTITMPAGIGIDAGAIGKGLAADLIVTELLAAGAEGVLMSLGGDLAFAGQAPTTDGWIIGVEDARGGSNEVVATWAFTSERGAVATSTTCKRRWANGTRHHSIDPRTGALTTSSTVQATVIADRAWYAEVSATAALVLDQADAITWLEDRELTGLLMTHDDITDLTTSEEK